MLLRKLIEDKKFPIDAIFYELYKLRNQNGWRFANLLEEAAKVAPEIRFRFTSPHPKDFPNKVYS